jgi:acetyl esterase/lipase
VTYLNAPAYYQAMNLALLKAISVAIALAVISLLLVDSPVFAQPETIPAPLTLPLWPVGFLSPKPNQAPEHDITTAKDALVGGRPLIRLTDVSNPTLTVYWPDPAKATRTAVVVLPGGGYRILAMDLEGTEICRYLNSIGVTAILLKYRVPTASPNTAPFQDVERAFSLVRSHAQEWKIDANRIGVMGFSAGGDLAARLSTNYGTRDYAPMDAVDQVSCRPDFAILIYPAYLAASKDGFTLASDLHVTSTTPTSFLVQAEDDPIGVMNSIDYYTALAQQKVPVEMHLYAEGGHGYGLRADGNTVTTWPARLEEWLRSIGMVSQ